jgi:hypothetical protein
MGHIKKRMVGLGGRVGRMTKDRRQMKTISQSIIIQSGQIVIKSIRFPFCFLSINHPSSSAFLIEIKNWSLSKDKGNRAISPCIHSFLPQDQQINSWLTALYPHGVKGPSDLSASCLNFFVTFGLILYFFVINKPLGGKYGRKKI